MKTLVLDDKWQATITARIASEAESLTLALVKRIQELGNRYAATIAILDAELEALEARVIGHLDAMKVER